MQPGAHGPPSKQLASNAVGNSVGSIAGAKSKPDRKGNGHKKSTKSPSAGKSSRGDKGSPTYKRTPAGWSPQELQLLKQAMKETADDPAFCDKTDKQVQLARWKEIGAIVKSKSAKECLDMYKI